MARIMNIDGMLTVNGDIIVDGSISILSRIATLNSKFNNYLEKQETAQASNKIATARTLTIGSSGKQFDGSEDVSWSLDEIGAAPSSHSHVFYVKDFTISPFTIGSGEEIMKSLSVSQEGYTAIALRSYTSGFAGVHVDAAGIDDSERASFTFYNQSGGSRTITPVFKVVYIRNT